jgi:hypothetical protein
MSIPRYVIFVAVFIAALWLVEKLSGMTLFDDADARTIPFRHVEPMKFEKEITP